MNWSVLSYPFLNDAVAPKIKTAIYFLIPYRLSRSVFSYQLTLERADEVFVYENSDENCFTRKIYFKIKVQDAAT